MASRRRPGTGETRKTNQPLKIDRLPPVVHEAICALRNQAGKTWQEIEDLSAEPFGKGQLGFVDWINLPAPVLELFPDMRLPHTNLQRWYDIRVRQVQASVLESAARAREIAEAFAKSSMDGADEAVLNAARDQIMTVISEDGFAGNRLKVAKALTALAEIMQTVRANTIKERKVSADERKLKLVERREALAMKKLEAETDKMAHKAERGEVTVDDINRIRERTFGLPPVKKKEG